MATLSARIHHLIACCFIHYSSTHKAHQKPHLFMLHAGRPPNANPPSNQPQITQSQTQMSIQSQLTPRLL